MKVNTNKSEISIKKKNKKLDSGSVNKIPPICSDGNVSKKKKAFKEKNKLRKKILILQKANDIESLKKNSVQSDMGISNKNFVNKKPTKFKKKKGFTSHTKKFGTNFHQQQDTNNMDFSTGVPLVKSSVKPNKETQSTGSSENGKEQSFKKKKFGSSIVQTDMNICKVNGNDKLKHKKKRKIKNKKALFTGQTESNKDFSQLQNAMEMNYCSEKTNQKSDKHSFEKSKEEEQPQKKKKTKLNSTADEYRPGMLSELLQKKKYGRLIIPWDPSFGLDPSYKFSEGDKGVDEETPKLKINPLFDLSKRKNEDSATEEGTGNIPTIFVGNLPVNATIPTIKRIFRKCGMVRKVKLRPQGLKEDNKRMNASVKFSRMQSCTAALKLNGKEFEGHHLRVTLANEPVKSDLGNGVFVGNLAFSAKDDDLWKAFSDCGEIESVRIIRDNRSGKGKGYGYVNFKSADAVDNALGLNGSVILDRNIRVNRNSDSARSRSNLDKVKRMKKKKLGNKSSRKPKDQSKDGGKSNQENGMKPKRSSADFHQSETEQPVVKKVKKKKKIAGNKTTELT